MSRKVWIAWLFLALVWAPGTQAQQFSDWSAAVNLGPIVNSTVEETDPFITKNGLSLYFSSPRPGGYGGYDIWVSQRASVDDPWGPPQNLGPTINTAASEGRPLLSVDGHRLYFTSDRPGEYGGNDIYVTRRHNKRDDFAWRTPENLGPGVNSFASDHNGSLFEDDETGATTFYFESDRLGTFDIFASTLQADETFGPAVLVEELSSPANDRRPMVRRDGLEMFLVSNRPGSILNPVGASSLDLWVSTRTSTSDPWSPPENVDPFGAKYINTRMHEGGPGLSFDGTILYFHAARRLENAGVGCPSTPSAPTCLFDIWMSTRTKLQGEQ